MQTRRQFLKGILTAGGALMMGKDLKANAFSPAKTTQNPKVNLYRTLNGTPSENMTKVIDLMGGIEKLVGSDDIILIKPNVQWWNQGAPNLSALRTFVDIVMDRSGGFQGEVVLAENCHRGPRPWESQASGWTRHFAINSDLPGTRNYNELSKLLKKRYGDRFTTCHWIDVGAGAKRVCGPGEGPGYVYCDGTNGVPLLSCDNGVDGEAQRSVVMSYPVCVTDTGKLIDFRKGVWEKGACTAQPLRFINFAALNHHSTYCGATSAIKNYLGVNDLSGGPDPHNRGRLTGQYYNFHSFPFDKWAPGPRPGMIGKEIAVFLNTVRRADLNVTTAEWVGLASRVDPPVSRTRAVLACSDPVALDYHATKYLLYPNSKIPFHDPDSKKSPLHQYLVKCAENGGGIFDERRVAVRSYDLENGKLQGDDDLVVRGERIWGREYKTILKYLYLRYG